MGPKDLLIFGQVVTLAYSWAAPTPLLPWNRIPGVIAFPRFKYEWMQRFLLPKGMSSDIHVHLEEHGTAVWEQIDGKSTIREIIEKLADHFNHEENYESRILAYFSQLQKDGFVKLTINE